MNATSFDDLVSVREAAQLLRVSESTMWRWIHDGVVRSHRVGKKRVYLKRSELELAVSPAPRRGGLSDADRKRLNAVPMSNPDPNVDPVALARALHERQRKIPGWDTHRPVWEDINEAREERSRQLDDLR
jgi:excisionase family DNA binding protein